MTMDELWVYLKPSLTRVVEDVNRQNKENIENHVYSYDVTIEFTDTLKIILALVNR